MNIRDLQYLVALAETLHFGKASLRCHVSQPTLSMQIQKLEEYLEIQLFERNNKQVLLTAAAKPIVADAKKILALHENIKQYAKNIQAPDTGDIRIGIYPTLAAYFLPKSIPLLHAHFPQLNLFIIEEKTTQLLNQLETGDLDCAFLSLPIQSQALEAQALFEESFYLAVSKEHPFSKRKKIVHADLTNQKVLLLDEGHCMRDQALSICQVDHADIDFSFRATSLESLRYMVAANLGLTLIPEIAILPHDPLVTYLPFARNAPTRAIGAVWRKSSARQVLFKKMAHILKQKMG